MPIDEGIDATPLGFLERVDNVQRRSSLRECGETRAAGGDWCRGSIRTVEDAGEVETSLWRTSKLVLERVQGGGVGA